MFSTFWQWHTRGYPQRHYACLWFLCKPFLTAACAWWYLFWHVWLHLTSQNNVIEYASEVNRIFQLHLDNTPQSHAFAANCEFKVLFDMWHWRLSHLGHTNIERLFKIIDSIDLKNLSWWHDVCELCMKVKQTCCSYNAFIEWVTWSLGLIHLNVVEPIMLTVYDSSRWFVTLTDDFTRFTWMFSWKSKTRQSSILRTLSHWWRLTVLTIL
jgi:hypothetical protein